MGSDRNWFFAITAPELRYVRDGSIVQRPKRVLVECLNSFPEADFNAIGQQVVLPQEIVLLDLCEELGIVFFSN
jgi:hypothetical protein